MSDLSDIYNGLMAAKASNESLAGWVRSADGRDIVRDRQRTIETALTAYDSLAGDLRNGRKYIEPPDDYKHTSCYCSAPTCSPPCGWCTDPENNEDESEGNAA